MSLLFKNYSVKSDHCFSSLLHYRPIYSPDSSCSCSNLYNVLNLHHWFILFKDSLLSLTVSLFTWLVYMQILQNMCWSQLLTEWYDKYCFDLCRTRLCHCFTEHHLQDLAINQIGQQVSLAKHRVGLFFGVRSIKPTVKRNIIAFS